MATTRSSTPPPWRPLSGFPCAVAEAAMDVAHPMSAQGRAFSVSLDPWRPSPLCPLSHGVRPLLLSLYQRPPCCSSWARPLLHNPAMVVAELPAPNFLPWTRPPPRVKGGQLPDVADHGCPAAGDFLPSAPPSEHPNSAPPCSIFVVPAPSSAHSGELLLAIRRGARRLFVKMRSKPRAAGSLFREAQWTARRRRSPWFAVFAQPLCRRRSPPVRPRRFMFDSASGYFPMINCVCAVWFLFCGGEEPCVLREEGQSFNTRRMFGAMHKSESPSFLQTPFGFVYGEPMHVALNRLD
jgi:hypothetical protein